MRKPSNPKDPVERALAVPPLHLVAAIALALFLVWYGANTAGGLWLDEATNLWVGDSRLKGKLLDYEGHPPFGQVLLSVPYVLTGNPQGARVLAAAVSVLTLALLYVFLARHAGRAAALLGIILLGTHPFFTRFAVQAMLDTLLTFAVLLSFVVLWNLPKREGGRGDAKALFALGICLGAAVSIKYTALLFALAMVPYLLWRREGGLRHRISGLLPLALGFLLAFSILHLPYLRILPEKVIAHQQTSARYAIVDSFVPGFLKPLHSTVYRMMPQLPAGVYYHYIIIAHHVDYLSRGHYILVGEKIYEHPPWWTFISWWDETLGPAAALFAGLIIIGAVLLKGPVRRTARALLFLIGTPFLLLSLLTMKSDFYVLPWLPLLVLGGILVLKNFPGVGRFAIVVLILLLFIPPGGVFLAGRRIALDTGYDKATRFIVEWAAAHPGQAVLAFHVKTVLFYITPEEYRNITFAYGDPYRDPPYNKCPYFENRTYGMFLDYREQRRFEDTETYRCSRELSTGRVELGDWLAAYLYG